MIREGVAADARGGGDDVKAVIGQYPREFGERVVKRAIAERDDGDGGRMSAMNPRFPIGHDFIRQFPGVSRGRGNQQITRRKIIIRLTRRRKRKVDHIHGDF